jgi:hypothetical protein
VLVAVWVALGVSVVVVLGTLGFALSRGLAAWRTFRRFRGRVADGQMELMHRVLGIERRMDAASASAARLQQAQAELQASLATGRTLAAAFGEVRATVGRVTGLAPSK